MTAPALLYQEDVQAGASGYAPTVALDRAWRAGRAVRLWRLGARIVSLQLVKGEQGETNGIWKAAERLPLSDPPAQLAALEAAGVTHPSSFASCYHQLAPHTKPLKYTYQKLFDWWPGGPWHEARQTGEFSGRWWRYDLRSAYRWAATLRLPDPESFYVRKGPVNGPGLWSCLIIGDRSHLPSVFQATGPVVLSTEEIEGYRLKVEVIRGVRWDRWLPADYVEQTLAKLPCPKEAGRAYWGRWIARDPVTAWTVKREWPLRNIFANFIWGWLIVGRVRLRVWRDGARAAHVYVDEMLVPHEVATGEGLGDWHLKQEYPRGVAVYRTGHYGPRQGAFTMQTGVTRNVA
jgi:hypothetical protein